MGCKDKRKAAACAMAARMAAFHAQNNTHNFLPTPESHFDIEDDVVNMDDSIPIIVDSDSDCGYNGGVNYYGSDGDSDKYLDENSGISDAESLKELKGVALEENLADLRAELKELAAATQYEQIMGPKSANQWKRVEKNWSLGYMGTSQHTQQRKAKEARKDDPQVMMMHTMFLKAPTSISTLVLTSEPLSPSKSQPAPDDNPPARQHVSFAHLTGYDSDESSEEDDTDSESEDRPVKVNKQLPIAPPLKRQKLVVTSL